MERTARPLHMRFGFINHVLGRRYRYLLYALVLFLVFPSFFFTTAYHREITYACLSLVLVMGVYAVHTTVTNMYIGLGMSALVIIINAGGLFSTNATVQFYVGFLFYMVFYSYVAYQLIRLIFRTSNVTIGVLFAAINVYLLVGIVGGFGFMLIENAFPGSLNNVKLESLTTDPAHFIYFSFMTMSTVGYGDITPATAPAESLAIVLSAFGPIYLTMLVAILVGRFITHRFQTQMERMER
ncbi:MAG: hypothetical protein IPO60_13055 [Flavobacteriales bacterium]|nr:hypothetical protein [Flavobacteriales bacterium]MBK9599210.1 hypothetical protein [Flavobacteriales bacterium]HQV39140.1 ion channel [Flavobacteriales bacterium]HQW32731.1 ion channel [Flavobacteriales bacterium]HQY03315.1 ion channel [Flavobacteriales bacterium]